MSNIAQKKKKPNWQRIDRVNKEVYALKPSSITFWNSHLRPGGFCLSKGVRVRRRERERFRVFAFWKNQRFGRRRRNKRRKNE